MVKLELDPNSGFPIRLLERMHLFWSKFLKQMAEFERGNGDGKKNRCLIDKRHLHTALSQIGCNLSEAEMAETVKVVNAGGPGYSGGCVSKERLLSKLAARIFPAQNDTGLSLHLPPQFRFARAEGRAKRFAALQAAWNNPYYQALDAPPPHAQTEDRLATSDAPIPAVAALVTGRFYAAPRFNPSTRQPLPEEELRRRATFDAVLGQPLVKGILEGSYMYSRDGASRRFARAGRKASPGAGVDFEASAVEASPVRARSRMHAERSPSRDGCGRALGYLHQEPRIAHCNGHVSGDLGSSAGGKLHGVQRPSHPRPPSAPISARGRLQRESKPSEGLNGHAEGHVAAGEIVAARPGSARPLGLDHAAVRAAQEFGRARLRTLAISATRKPPGSIPMLPSRAHAEGEADSSAKRASELGFVDGRRMLVPAGARENMAPAAERTQASSRAPSRAAGGANPRPTSAQVAKAAAGLLRTQAAAVVRAEHLSIALAPKNSAQSFASVGLQCPSEAVARARQ